MTLKKQDHTVSDDDGILPTTGSYACSDVQTLAFTQVNRVFSYARYGFGVCYRISQTGPEITHFVVLFHNIGWM